MKKNFIIALPIVLSTAFFANTCLFAEKINRKFIKEQILKHNSAIAVAKLKLENAKQAYNNSLGAFLPEIDFRGQLAQNEREEVFSKNYTYGLNASISVFSGFGSYNDAKDKAAQINFAKADYNREVANAAYKAETEYINLMWAYETAELLKKVLDRIKENKDMLKLKYNSGNVDFGSLKRVEADVLIAEYELKKAQRYIETVSAALLVMMARDDITTLLEPEDKLECEEEKLPITDYDNIVSTIHEYLKAKYNLESFKAQKAKTIGQRLPSVSLSGGISRFDDKWQPNKKSWGAEATVVYPLFAKGQEYSNFKIASNQLKIALENLEETKRTLKAQAVSYYNDLLDAYEMVFIREQYLKAVQTQIEISTRKYVNGLSAYSDWYSIENDYISSQKALLDAKKNAAFKKAEWYKFIGKGFEEK